MRMTRDEMEVVGIKAKNSERTWRFGETIPEFCGGGLRLEGLKLLHEWWWTHVIRCRWYSIPSY